MPSVKEICDQYNLKMVELSKRFDIPYRTVQDWYYGKRTPPEYMVTMILKELSEDSKKEG